MNYISIEIVSTIIFLIGLVVIYNLRSIIEKDSKISFIYIATGLSLLALCSAFSILAMQKVFTNIPILESTIFFQLLYWIGMITGLTLLLSGVSNWLPVYRNHIKVNSHALMKLELFKKIEQLIRFENRNNIILLQTIELMRLQYNFSEVSCFLFSQQEKKMKFLAVSNNESNSIIRSHAIHFYDSAISESIENRNIELIYISETQESAPDLLVPMIVKGKLLGAFCFYSEQNIDEQSIINLKLISDIISEKIYQDSLKLQNESIKKQLAWIGTLDSSIDNTTTVKENITAIKRILNKVTTIDFLTISYTHNHKITKLTISDNNQVLESVNNVLIDQNDLVRFVADTNQNVVIQNVEKETDFIIDIQALQSDMKSIAAYPISIQNDNIGVVVLGSKKYNAFSTSQETYFEILARKLGNLVLNSTRQIQEKKNLTQRETVNTFIRKVSNGITTTELYPQLTECIINEMDASFARISLFGQDRRFLNSQVLSLSNDAISATPADAAMMLTLMPNHRNILHSRKTILVNNNSDISDETLIEQRQIFGAKLSNYVISPIYTGSTISGVLTVGYTQANVEISKSEISLIEDIASVISVQNNFKLQKRHVQSKPATYNRIQKSKSSQKNKIVFQDEIVGV